MKFWLYKGEEIRDMNDINHRGFASYYGFIYITFWPSREVAYLGKKALYHSIKRVKSKKELLVEGAKRGRKSKYKVIKKESDWKTYFGSNKEIKQLIKEGKEKELIREILLFVPTKKLLTYYETKYLFTNEVLEHPDKWLNDNILGKFYTKDFDL